tara:strand:- start:65 stop:739 length:675 start_codon:yes stop_codon:yes gene_type:complete
MRFDFPKQDSADLQEILRFDEVDFSWEPNKKIIDNCSFSIPHTGLWMIVGKNGSGKSTLTKLIKGVLEPQGGRITCQSRISMVFQNPDHQLLFPSCGSEILLNLNCTKDFEITKINQMIENILKRVGMNGFKNRPIHTLSGGQKQRLAIAALIASRSNLLLFDEPTALLDKVSQFEILRLVQDLTNDKHNPLTALWITHRLDELIYATAIAKMKNGKLSNWKFT